MQACRIPAFTGLKAVHAASRPRSAGASQQQQQRGQLLTVRASVVAEPVSLDVKTLEGASAGTASIALRVADADTAKGLVHRYLVTVQQNARQVRECPDSSQPAAAARECQSQPAARAGPKPASRESRACRRPANARAHPGEDAGAG